jgi:hypothetical protein
MNRIGLSLRRIDRSMTQVPEIDSALLLDVRIDGRSFIEIVRELEMPFAVAEGSPQIAGRYESVPVEGVIWDIMGHHDDKVVVLDCDCGVPRCWPLLMRVQRVDEVIRWFDFVQPFRGPNREVWWRLDLVAPFEFDAEQYDHEVAMIREQL